MHLGTWIHFANFFSSHLIYPADSLELSLNDTICIIKSELAYIQGHNSHYTHKCLKETTPTTTLLSPWKSETKRKTGMQWIWGGASAVYKNRCGLAVMTIVQELCESRGGHPGLSVPTSLLVSMDVKLYWTMLRHWSQLVPNMSTDIWGH